MRNTNPSHSPSKKNKRCENGHDVAIASRHYHQSGIGDDVNIRRGRTSVVAKEERVTSYYRDACVRLLYSWARDQSAAIDCSALVQVQAAGSQREIGRHLLHHRGKNPLAATPASEQRIWLRSVGPSLHFKRVWCHTGRTTAKRPPRVDGRSAYRFLSENHLPSAHVSEETRPDSPHRSTI